MAEAVIDMVETGNGIWNATINGIKNQKGSVMVAGDASGNPFWNDDRKVWGDDQKHHSIIPIEYTYRPARRWAAAIKSPKGHFLTHICVLDAFRSGWDYVEPENHKNHVEVELEHELKKLCSEYKLKHVHTKAVQLAKSMGKSLAIKMPFKGHGRWAHLRIQYRVIPLDDMYIQFDMETGFIKYFNPIIMIGRLYKQLMILPKDAVLYVNKPDPFGNTYQGIPDTYVVYDQLKWMANIERGFATAIDARGISMIHVAIKGFELEDRDKWKKAYGNPSSYNVLFSDENTEVKNIPGVAASFDLNSTNDALNKEVASGSGYAMSRIDGSQRGQVTGTQQDTDNYYAMISSMQEEFENELIELHEKLRADLINGWDISWEVVQKMDKQRKAEIFATEVNSAQVALDFLTYNQILERFGYDPVPDGDIQASVYIHNMYVDAGMEMDIQDELEAQNPPEGGGGSKAKEGSSSAIGGARKEQTKKPNKNDDERAKKSKGKDTNGDFKQCKAVLASGRQCLNFTDDSSGLCYIHRKGKVGGAWGSKKGQKKAELEGKKRSATRLRKGGDSNREINDFLRKVYGDAFSFGDLAVINDKVLRESRSKADIDTKDMRGFNDLNISEVLIMLGIDSRSKIGQMIGILNKENKTNKIKRSNKEIVILAINKSK